MEFEPVTFQYHGHLPNPTNQKQQKVHEAQKMFLEYFRAAMKQTVKAEK